MERILKPEKVYVTEEVYDCESYVARLGRMMTGIDSEPPQKVTEAELNEIAKERRWSSFGRWGQREYNPDPDLVFTTVKFRTPEERKERAEKYPHLRFRDMLGHNACSFRADGS